MFAFNFQIVTYPLAIRIVERFEFYNIRVADNAHNLQFTILVILVYSTFHISIL